MLEKPAIQDQDIVACLQTAYEVAVAQIAFLPLGADVNTAVYRATTSDGTSYFVKLRRGVFDEISVALPRLLHDQGVAHIIAPLPANTGQLWASLRDFTLVLYPFVEGRSGYEVALSERLWHEFGSTLKHIHAAVVPHALAERIPRETYSPQWREQVRVFLERAERDMFDDLAARQLAAILKARRGEVLDLIARAERYAGTLRARTPEHVLCHADIHPGNLLIGAGEAFYIVDWDTPLLAPRERDLMFIGGGLGFSGYTAQEEETLFYGGYGQTPIDPLALAYYRFERIIQDIAAYCEQLFLTTEGGEDRVRSLRYVMSNFLPGGTIERAYAADPAWSDRAAAGW